VPTDTSSPFKGGKLAQTEKASPEKTYSVTKADLRLAILEHLRAELALITRAAQLARDEAISEESRAENKYDTRGQEAADLAEGQARLAAEIETSIAVYTTLLIPDFSPDQGIAVGAVVEVQTPTGDNATSSGHAPAAWRCPTRPAQFW
jgi:hypothetical protein